MEAKESTGEIILYQADGATRLEVKLRNDTVWLTQGQMAELFEKDRTVIGRHISNIFKEHELSPRVVVKEFLTATRHGALKGKTQHQKVAIYKLDIIISVGYRGGVNACLYFCRNRHILCPKNPIFTPWLFSCICICLQIR